MNKHKKRIFLLLVFIGMIISARSSSLGALFTLENLKQHREELAVLVQDHYWLSVISFIAVYVLTVSLSLPGAVILTLGGGFLFGALATTLYVDIAATAGATLAFLSARYLIGNILQKKYQDQFNRFNKEIERNGTSYLLSLRLIPLFPFFLINFLSGLTKIPVGTFLWTTLIGIIPGTAVYAFAGQQIGSINTLSEILSTKMFVAFGFLALFAFAPVIWQRLKHERKLSATQGQQ